MHQMNIELDCLKSWHLVWQKQDTQTVKSGHFIKDHESRELFYFLVSIGIFDIVFPHAESEKKKDRN